MKVTLRTIKRRLDKAIACAEKRGAKLRPHVTLQYEGIGKQKHPICCPIGAYALCELGASPNSEKSNLNVAGDALGFEGFEIDAFVYGFDGYSKDDYPAPKEFPALYRLGRQYRKQAGL